MNTNTHIHIHPQRHTGHKHKHECAHTHTPHNEEHHVILEIMLISRDTVLTRNPISTHFIRANCECSNSTIKQNCWSSAYLKTARKSRRLHVYAHRFRTAAGHPEINSQNSPPVQTETRTEHHPPSSQTQTRSTEPLLLKNKLDLLIMKEYLLSVYYLITAKLIIKSAVT